MRFSSSLSFFGFFLLSLVPLVLSAAMRTPDIDALTIDDEEDTDFDEQAVIDSVNRALDEGDSETLRKILLNGDVIFHTDDIDHVLYGAVFSYSMDAFETLVDIRTHPRYNEWPANYESLEEDMLFKALSGVQPEHLVPQLFKLNPLEDIYVKDWQRKSIKGHRWDIVKASIDYLYLHPEIKPDLKKKAPGVLFNDSPLEIYESFMGLPQLELSFVSEQINIAFQRPNTNRFNAILKAAEKLVSNRKVMKEQIVLLLSTTFRKALMAGLGDYAVAVAKSESMSLEFAISVLKRIKSGSISANLLDNVVMTLAERFDMPQSGIRSQL